MGKSSLTAPGNCGAGAGGLVGDDKLCCDPESAALRLGGTFDSFNQHVG